jgi:putative aldouronate transport system substrate-binding protein
MKQANRQVSKSMRNLRLVLAVLLIFGMMACGGGGTTAPASSSAPATSSVASTASSEAQPSQSGEPSSEEAGYVTFPIVETPITITAMGLVSPQGGDHNDTYCWTEYEKMTNVIIEWENVPTDVKDERISVALASNMIPDMLYGLQIKAADVVKYGGYGVFLPLEDLIRQYAFHFQDVMAEDAEVRKGITMPDGHIYALPNMKAGPLMKNNMHFINPVWLENVGMEMPTNLDEFADVMRAFRDQDANGNGDPNDELPFASRTSFFIKLWQTYFGLGTRGVKHDYVDVDPATNQIRFMPTTEQYKDMITYLNMMYSEKLVDNEVFTMSASRDMVAKLTPDLVGSHGDYSTNCGPEMQEIFRVIPLMDNYYGEKTWTRSDPTIASIGSFLLSSKTEYAKEMIQWVDYFYGDEGQLMYNMGIEGVTFEYDADGKLKYTDQLLNNPDGLTLTQVRTKYMGFQASAGINSDKYYKGAETYWTSEDGLPYYQPYIKTNQWPELPMTGEEADEFSALMSDIKAYSDEMFAAFVTGKKPIDDWDSYVAEYEKLNVARLLEMYESISARYESN